jgi:putative RecB family exonuclease
MISTAIPNLSGRKKVVLPDPRDYLSYSAVRTFQSCPLKYRFRYLDGLPEACTFSSLVFGSVIHAAIETYFQARLLEDPLPDLEALMASYRQYWQANQTVPIQFGATDSPESLEQLAQRMLAKFLASDLVQPEGRIIGIEEELRGELVPGVPDLLGRVDLILETDEHVIIQDFKTARSAWSPDQADESSEQLLLYGDLIRQLVPGKDLKLRFAIITKAKEPKVQVIDAKFDAERLDRTKQMFKTVWSAIQAGNFYPSPSPMTCTNCGYRSA